MKSKKKLKKKNINKKGFLLGKTTVEVLIALIAIVILIILGVKLFGMFSKANEEKKADEVLDEIALKLEYLQSSEYTLNEIEVIVHPPVPSDATERWYLKSYFIETDASPNGECVGTFDSCLCVCKTEDENRGCTGLKACKGFKESISVRQTYTPPGSRTTRTTENYLFQNSVTKLRLYWIREREFDGAIFPEEFSIT